MAVEIKAYYHEYAKALADQFEKDLKKLGAEKTNLDTELELAQARLAQARNRMQTILREKEARINQCVAAADANVAQLRAQIAARSGIEQAVALEQARIASDVTRATKNIEKISGELANCLKPLVGKSKKAKQLAEKLDRYVRETRAGYPPDQKTEIDAIESDYNRWLQSQKEYLDEQRERMQSEVEQYQRSMNAANAIVSSSTKNLNIAKKNLERLATDRQRVQEYLNTLYAPSIKSSQALALLNDFDQRQLPEARRAVTQFEEGVKEATKSASELRRAARARFGPAQRKHNDALKEAQAERSQRLAEMRRKLEPLYEAGEQTLADLRSEVNALKGEIEQTYGRNYEDAYNIFQDYFSGRRDFQTTNEIIGRAGLGGSLGAQMLSNWNSMNLARSKLAVLNGELYALRSRIATLDSQIAKLAQRSAPDQAAISQLRQDLKTTLDQFNKEIAGHAEKVNSLRAARANRENNRIPIRLANGSIVYTDGSSPLQDRYQLELEIAQREMLLLYATLRAPHGTFTKESDPLVSNPRFESLKDKLESLPQGASRPKLNLTPLMTSLAGTYVPRSVGGTVFGSYCDKEHARCEPIEAETKRQLIEDWRRPLERLHVFDECRDNIRTCLPSQHLLPFSAALFDRAVAAKSKIEKVTFKDNSHAYRVTMWGRTYWIGADGNLEVHDPQDDDLFRYDFRTPDTTQIGQDLRALHEELKHRFAGRARELSGYQQGSLVLALSLLREADEAQREADKKRMYDASVGVARLLLGVAAPELSAAVDLCEAALGRTVDGRTLSANERFTSLLFVAATNRVLVDYMPRFLQRIEQTEQKVAGLKSRIDKPSLDALIKDFRATAGEGGVVRYTPINPGPLHEIEIESSALGVRRVSDTFRSGTYAGYRTSSKITVYRVVSPRNGAEVKIKDALGHYWSRVKPTGPTQAMLDAALDPTWGNRATHVLEMELPAGFELFEGFTAAIKNQEKGVELLGGGSQIFIPGIKKETLLPRGVKINIRELK